MQTYRRRADGAVVTIAELFPDGPPNPVPTTSVQLAAAAGADPITILPPPVAGPLERLMPAPLTCVDGEWQQGWELAPLPPAEAAALTARQWDLVRAARNARLTDSDWTQLPDASADKAAWATYRQSLRDITDQPDPWAITWPAVP